MNSSHKSIQPLVLAPPLRSPTDRKSLDFTSCWAARDHLGQGIRKWRERWAGEAVPLNCHYPLPDEGHKVENVTLTSILQTFSFLLPSILLLLSGMSCPTSSPSQGVSGKYFQILTLALLSRDTAGVNHVNVNFHETLLNGFWLY